MRPCEFSVLFVSMAQLFQDWKDSQEAKVNQFVNVRFKEKIDLIKENWEGSRSSLVFDLTCLGIEKVTNLKVTLTFEPDNVREHTNASK